MQDMQSSVLEMRCEIHKTPTGSGSKNKGKSKPIFSAKRPDGSCTMGKKGSSKSSRTQLGDQKKKALSIRPQANNIDRKGSSWSLVSAHSTSALSDTSVISDSGIQYSDSHQDYLSVNSLKSGDSMNSLDNNVHYLSDTHGNESVDDCFSGDTLQRGGGTIDEGVAEIASLMKRPHASENTSAAHAAEERTFSNERSIESEASNADHAFHRLPSGWLMRKTTDGRPYFINKKKRITTWLDPRTGRPAAATQTPGRAPPPPGAQQSAQDAALPEGWEMGVTDSGTPYFIDHINRQTTWEDPRLTARPIVDAETRRQRLCLQQLKIANSEIRVQIEMIRKKQAQLEQEMLRSASPETIKLAKARAHADAYNLVTLKAQHDTFQRQIESHMVQLHGENSETAMSMPPMSMSSAHPSASSLSALSTHVPALGTDGHTDSIKKEYQLKSNYIRQNLSGASTPVGNSELNPLDGYDGPTHGLPTLDPFVGEPPDQESYPDLEDMSGLLTPTMGGLVSPVPEAAHGSSKRFSDMMGVFDIGANTTAAAPLQSHDIADMLNDMPITPTGLFGSDVSAPDEFFGSWDV
eukprot:m.259715 g.259715  ORF g.259715 m.259715 type:complete len:579 (-) comp19668_c0_seq3:208-1944(-)